MTDKEKYIKDSEKEGWILIGELEWGDVFPFSSYKFEKGELPWFLFTKVRFDKESPIYYYSFATSLIAAKMSDWILAYPTRYSVNTILTDFISRDFVYQYSPLRGGKPIRKSEDLKIKLVGSDWIYPNKEYLNKEINIEELESLFRSDREKDWRDKMMKNKYMSEDDKKNLKITV